jgi:hypothetical protein
LQEGTRRSLQMLHPPWIPWSLDAMHKVSPIGMHAAVTVTTDDSAAHGKRKIVCVLHFWNRWSYTSCCLHCTQGETNGISKHARPCISAPPKATVRNTFTEFLQYDSYSFVRICMSRCHVRVTHIMKQWFSKVS